MFELTDSDEKQAIIKVIGVGGGGSNTINYMSDCNSDDVLYLCIDTDKQALSKEKKLLIGEQCTKGFGAKSNPEVGRQAAIEDIDRIRSAILDTDILFLTGGLGGGTSTGALPVIAQMAKELGVLTIAVVSTPLLFEGVDRNQYAVDGIEELRHQVDSLIVIPCDKVLSTEDADFDLLEAFNLTNKILSDSIRGIMSLISHPGVINADITDLKTIFRLKGKTAIGFGVSDDVDGRANIAVRAALTSKLLVENDLRSARGMLVSVSGTNLTLGEFEDVGTVISEFASEEAIVVMATSIDEELTDALRVTVVCTGITKGKAKSVLVKDLESSDFTEAILKAEDIRNDGIKIYTSESTPDEEIAELILHLSNVYKSIGGDELVVNSVKNVPPHTSSASITKGSVKRSATR